MSDQLSKLTGEVPASLKSKVLPLLLRAKELNEVYPLVSYYCLLKTMTTAHSTMQQDPSAKAFLLDCIPVVEQAKEQVKDILPEAEGTVNGYISSLFLRADTQERSGQADQTTAMSFRVASQLIPILEEFGPLDDEWKQKRKYAMVKAQAILQAIKDGTIQQKNEQARMQHEQAVQQLANSSADDTDATEGSSAVPQSPAEAAIGLPAPPMYNQVSADVAIAAAKQVQDLDVGPPTGGNDVSEQFPVHAPDYGLVKNKEEIDRCIKAEETVRAALSSLMFDDKHEAIKNLKSALALLEQ